MGARTMKWTAVNLPSPEQFPQELPAKQVTAV
jgi:hypothetical protein